MWLFYALMASLFSALTAILGKIGVQGLDSNLATAIRTVVVLVFAWLVVCVTGTVRQLPTIPHRSLIFLILSGLATGGAWMFYYKALQVGDVSKVAPVDKLSIVLTMILAFIVLQEVPTMKTVLGGVMVALGVLILAI